MAPQRWAHSGRELGVIEARQELATLCRVAQVACWRGDDNEAKLTDTA